MYVNMFCNLCWRTKTVLDSWHTAHVRMIFKKGDPAQRENYRPISVLNLGYKVFGSPPVAMAEAWRGRSAHLAHTV